MSEELCMEELSDEDITRLTAVGKITTSYTFGPTFFVPQLTLVCAKTKKTFKYAPQEDISNIDLARMLELFTYMAASHGAIAFVDVEAFVNSHKLERHFQIT